MSNFERREYTMKIYRPGDSVWLCIPAWFKFHTNENHWIVCGPFIVRKIIDHPRLKKGVVILQETKENPLITSGFFVPDYVFPSEEDAMLEVLKNKPSKYVKPWANSDDD